MRLVDVDYQLFMSRLSKASDKGELIEKKEKQRWKAYVKENGVYEGAAMMYARDLSNSVKPVIIDSDDDWKGYYLYSKQDAICLKFRRSG